MPNRFASAIIVLAAASASVAFSSNAFAEDIEEGRCLEEPAPAAPSAPVQTKPASRWYGWQTLTTDGAALTLFVLSTQRSLGWDGLDSPSMLVWASAATFALGGPVVHLAHGRPVAALVSLGARTVVPTALLFGVGYGTYGLMKAGGDDDGLGRAIVALGLGVLAGGAGMASAIALDAGVLAREAPSPPTSSSARIGRIVSDVSLGPQLDITGSPRGIALSGRLF